MNTARYDDLKYVHVPLINWIFSFCEYDDDENIGFTTMCAFSCIYILFYFSLHNFTIRNLGPIIYYFKSSSFW